LAYISLELWYFSCLQDNKYDAIPDFEILLSRFTEKPRVEETLCQMGSFYLFIKNDLATAYKEYWSKVISLNPYSDKLKVIYNNKTIVFILCLLYICPGQIKESSIGFCFL
jgi:hypothetical protein